MRGLQLIKVDYDLLENDDAIRKTLVATVIEDSKHTAHAKMGEVVSKYSFHHYYLGNDGEVYPKFEVQRIEII